MAFDAATALSAGRLFRQHLKGKGKVKTRAFLHSSFYSSLFLNRMFGSLHRLVSLIERGNDCGTGSSHSLQL